MAVLNPTDRLRVHRRDIHPVQRAAIRRRRRHHLGHQLRTQPSPDAGTQLLVGTGRSLGPDVAGRGSRRSRPGAADAAAPGDSLCAVRGAGRPCAGCVDRAGCPLRAHPADLGVRHAEPRLRNDRGGPGRDQPDPVRAEPDREATVLSRRAGAVQPADPDVLHAPHWGHLGRRQDAGQARGVELRGAVHTG